MDEEKRRIRYNPHPDSEGRDVPRFNCGRPGDDEVEEAFGRNRFKKNSVFDSSPEGGPFERCAPSDRVGGRAAAAPLRRAVPRRLSFLSCLLAVLLLCRSAGAGVGVLANHYAAVPALLRKLLCCLVLFSVSISWPASERAYADKDEGHLYFLLKIKSDSTVVIDFLFVKTGNEYIDPQKIIRKKGREFFRKMFLSHKTFHYTDGLGRRNEIVEVDFEEKEPYMGEPTYFYYGKSVSGQKIRRTAEGDRPEFFIASSDKRPERAEFMESEDAKEPLRKRAEKIGRRYADAVFKRVRSERGDEYAISLHSIEKKGESIFTDFDGDRKQDLLVAWTANLDFTIKKTGKPQDIYPFPFLSFVYGNGNTYTTEDVGQRIEPLYRIEPIMAIDINGDGRMDVLTYNTYYESNFYSITSGTGRDNGILVRTYTRYVE